MLLDRRKVKFWQKIVFTAMAIIMAGFLLMIPLGGNMGCGSDKQATSAADTAIAKDKAALKADPKNAAAWKTLGDDYVSRANMQAADSKEQKSDWLLAVAAYKRANKLLSKQKGAAAKTARLDVLDNLNNVYLFLKDYQAVVNVYGEITTLKPKDANAYFEMATAAMNANDTDTALLAFSKFLELDPNSPYASDVKQWIKDNTPKSTSTKGTGQ